MPSTGKSDSPRHENPLGLAGIEFVEFAAFDGGETRALADTLEALGFVKTSWHRSKDVWLYRQGDINLILDLEPDSLARSFATVHGVSVCAMAFRVNDAEAAHASVVGHGAQDYRERTGPNELLIPAVRDHSGSLIYFVDRFGQRGSIYEIDFEDAPAPSGSPGDADLHRIDHVSLSVRRGRTRKWVNYYSHLFGFYEVDFNCITDPEGYVLSTVVTCPEGDIQICINEPMDENTNSALFLKENFGEGVQHIAFETRDIMGFMEKAEQRNLETLPISSGYYHDLEKEGYDPALVDRLRRHNVMIDTEGGGRFLHAYTRPVENRFFFEVVQRDDHTGFGRHDVTARLLALQGKEEVAAHVRGRLPTVERYSSSVDNQTVLLGTIGDPISQLRTPETMGKWLAKHGLNATWLPFHVRPSELEAFTRGARSLDNLAGFSIALPHKMAVMPMLDEVTPRGKRVGAVNVVRREQDGRLIGDNMESLGFLRGLESTVIDVSGASVWLVGAGSTGRAVAFALAEAGARSLAIEDFSGERVEGLVADLGEAFAELSVVAGGPDPKRIDIAVNATPTGMAPDDPLPFDPRRLRADAAVVEVILAPEETHLLLEAKRHGCTVCPGKHMLEHQLALFAEFLGLNR